MTPISLSRRGRRDLAWQLRHERGWPVARIATKLGVKPPAISRLLRRAADGRDDAPAQPPRAGTMPPSTRPRAVKVLSLSDAYNS